MRARICVKNVFHSRENIPKNRIKMECGQQEQQKGLSFFLRKMLKNLSSSSSSSSLKNEERPKTVKLHSSWAVSIKVEFDKHNGNAVPNENDVYLVLYISSTSFMLFGKEGRERIGRP